MRFWCFPKVLRSRSLALLGVAAAALATASVAWAATGPIHAPYTLAGGEDLPAGTLCDFHYLQSFTFTGHITIFSDRTEIYLTVQTSHTNADTNLTLTETDHTNVTIYPDNSFTTVGLTWHLRDAAGKIVAVHAGEATYDNTGAIVKFTPNSGADFAQVICTALGGRPV